MFGGGEYDDGSFSGSQYQGGGYVDSPAQPKKTISNAPADQSLLPVRIEQLMNATGGESDEALQIDGIPVSYLEVVGKVVRTEISSANNTYVINDDTGDVGIKYWFSQDDSDPAQTSLQDITDGSWIRAIGRLHEFKNEKQLQAYHIAPINDEKEIELHYLESKYAHLQNTTARQQLSFGAGTATSAMAGGAGMTGNSNNASNSGAAAGGNFDAMDVVDGEGLDGLSALERRVMNCIQKPEVANSEEGAPIESIITALPSDDINDVREALERLTNEGLIYTTIDEEHFRPTHVGNN